MPPGAPRDPTEGRQDHSIQQDQCSAPRGWPSWHAFAMSRSCSSTHPADSNGSRARAVRGSAETRKRSSRFSAVEPQQGPHHPCRDRDPNRGEEQRGRHRHGGDDRGGPDGDARRGAGEPEGATSVLGAGLGDVPVDAAAQRRRWGRGGPGRTRCGGEPGRGLRAVRRSAGVLRGGVGWVITAPPAWCLPRPRDTTTDPHRPGARGPGRGSSVGVSGVRLVSSNRAGARLLQRPPMCSRATVHAFGLPRTPAGR